MGQVNTGSPTAALHGGGYNRDGSEELYGRAVQLCKTGHRGDAGEAVELLLEALAIRPNEFRYLKQLGIALDEHDRPREALRYLERAALVEPDDPDIYHSLALVHSRLGNVPQELAALEICVELWDRWGQGRINLVESAYGILTQSSIVSYRVEALAALGINFAYRGRVTEAIPLFQKILDLGYRGSRLADYEQILGNLKRVVSLGGPATELDTLVPAPFHRQYLASWNIELEIQYKQLSEEIVLLKPVGTVTARACLWILNALRQLAELEGSVLIIDTSCIDRCDAVGIYTLSTNSDDCPLQDQNVIMLVSPELKQGCPFMEDFEKLFLQVEELETALFYAHDVWLSSAQP